MQQNRRTLRIALGLHRRSDTDRCVGEKVSSVPVPKNCNFSYIAGREYIHLLDTVASSATQINNFQPSIFILPIQ